MRNVRPRGDAQQKVMASLERFCFTGSCTKCTSYTSHRSVHKNAVILRHDHVRIRTQSTPSPLPISQSLFTTELLSSKHESIQASPLSTQVKSKNSAETNPSPENDSVDVDFEQTDVAIPPQVNNGKAMNSEGFLVNRHLRIKKKQPPTTLHVNTQNESGNSSFNQKDNGNGLSGYKYRLLKTPQLTNELISIPGPQDEIASPLPAPLSTSHWEEKEAHDIQQLRQLATEFDAASEPSQRVFPKSVNDVISSHWWRNLYENIRNPNSSRNNSKLSSQSFRQSLRNRRSSLLLEEIINNDSYTGFLPDERQQQEEEESRVAERIRVRSVQAASSIDVVAVLSKVFGGGMPRSHPLADFFATSPILRHVFGRTNVIIQLSPPPSSSLPSLSPSVPRYVAIYRFGSVVFFNITTKEASRLLEQIKKHSIHPIPVGFERREHYEMALQPQLETAAGKITADRALVRELDMNTVGVVSNIMGQTVALDWHLDTVDELLRNFSDINSSVESTGNFTSMERHTLFQVVARNNSLFIEMVGKLGIKDRSDTAWHLSQYEGLHEGMRKEFELDERFRVSIVVELVLVHF
jgi:uncharacterized Rmd1/YagE family protein